MTAENSRADALTDAFRGDNDCLIRNIKALLELDADGALVPHGIGGLARAYLTAAAVRLPASTSEMGEEGVLINEIFERQQDGFERCFEALGIADDRERSWSSLVMAINDALNASEEEADNEPNYLRDTGRTLEGVCGLPELEAGASEAVAMLHDDGHYVWNPKVSKPDGYDRAGWKMPVYATPQPTQADDQKGTK